MRNLLAFVGAALVAFLALGWYLDWYKIQSTPAGIGQRHFSVDVNTKKIEADVHKGVTAGEEKLQKVLQNDGNGGHTGDSLLQEAEQPKQEPRPIKPTPSAKESDWIPLLPKKDKQDK